MLFAVTLPAHAIENEKIHDVQVRFNKHFNKLSFWMLGFLIPFFILHFWTAYQVIYFLAWLMVFLIIMVIPFRRAFRDTMVLKAEHDWFVGTKRIIQSDLRVAQLKNQRSAPSWLFTVPLAMAIGLILWGARNETHLLGITSGGLVLTVIFFLIALQTRRSKARVYSTNSDVNLSLNQAHRRAVSYLWLSLAIIENIHFLLIYIFISNENQEMVGVWLAIMILFSVIPTLIIWRVYRNIAILEQDVLAQDGKVVYTDDDEYWANGFTYHNPQDRTLMVPKRVGVGLAINTGILTGKIIMGGILGLTAIVILGVSFMLIRSELTMPTLTITADQRIEIDYPMYSIAFSPAEIEQLMLVERIPKGTRTNGEATEKYLRGKFNLNELGHARLYIIKNNPPYLQIKLKNTYILYNEQDPLQTKQLYEQLKKQVGER